MMKLARRQRQKRRSGRRNGSSLLELLLALVVFQLAALTVTSLYMRAVLDVRRGGVRSAAAVAAQNRLEVLAPPADPVTAPPDPVVQYLSAQTRQWLAQPPPPPDRVLWMRETTTRFHPLAALADGRIERGETAPSAGGPPGVALMGIQVTVSRPSRGPSMATLERLEWIVR